MSQIHPQQSPDYSVRAKGGANVSTTRVGSDPSSSTIAILALVIACIALGAVLMIAMGFRG